MGEGELLFLLKGFKWTVVLAGVSFLCGTVTGLAIALLRTSGYRAVERTTAAYIALFQGTPLLMQLFVVYYALALYGLEIDAWIAVAIGFTLHASAYLGEIWRGSIEAVPRGQVEAAKALSLHYFLANERYRSATSPAHFTSGDDWLPCPAHQRHVARGVCWVHRIDAGRNDGLKPNLQASTGLRNRRDDVLRPLLAAVILRQSAGKQVCRGHEMIVRRQCIE
jgi:His/Glu/Gln/Arg/opine family amino acid ABC transporter permease subunit